MLGKFRMPSKFFGRKFSTLVLSEQFEGKLNANLASILSAAGKFNEDVDVLVHGSNTAT
jgi:hypothetical protein